MAEKMFFPSLPVQLSGGVVAVLLGFIHLCSGLMVL